MKQFWRHLGNLYVPNRFFWVLGGIVVVFILGFSWSWAFALAKTLVVALVALLIVDSFLLFNGNVRVRLSRKLPNVFSLGDDNRITIDVENLSGLTLDCEIIDELPEQFQDRSWHEYISLSPSEKKRFTFTLRPLVRGEYNFGRLIAYITSPIGLVTRRVAKDLTTNIPVYPSIIQMKKYELQAFAQLTSSEGIKRLRRLGHSYEFEQIKPYVRGDDYRSINWKATSRRMEVMVNQYEDERAQQVYSIIDKSRAMRMPFGGLSLLDYAINTSLTISNIALRKHDKAGLITFSDKLGSTIRADRSRNQLKKIMESLYREKERKLEANFELLYMAVRNVVKGRSLILLYSNFESLYALERALPILRKINRLHLLVVLLFENTELNDFAYEPADDVESIYTQTIAQNFVEEKKQMARELNRAGIQAILTRPEDLSINTVNKYLELKSRGLI